MSAHADAGEIMRWLVGFSTRAAHDLSRARRPGRRSTALAATDQRRTPVAGAHRRAISSASSCLTADVGYEQDGTDDARARDSTAAPADRRYLLERIGEAAVVQVYADGFRDSAAARQDARLASVRRRRIAGRDIFYDQRYAHNLEMRDVLEAIVTHRRRRRPARRSPRSSATPSCSGSTPGPYNNLTARKFVLDVHAGGVRRRGARRRARRRARSRCEPARRSTQLLARLRPMFFDPDRRSDGHQQDAAARARTSSRPAPTTSTSA